MLPLVTIVGLQIGGLLSGAVLTETIFNLPGLGNTALQSIQSFDLPVTQGVVIFGTLSILTANLIVDLGYSFLDPRVRLA